MPKSILTLMLTLLVCLGSPAVGEISQEEMRSLDEQVQEIKSDVLDIASELSLLQEQLLFPSNTQLAVFVSLAEDAEFRLDAVQIQLNGAPAAHHIYSFKELEALQKGGVQRLYTGNVARGGHELRVSAAGKLPNGSDFTWVESFNFSKDVEPQLLGISLAGPQAGGAPIRLEDW